MFRCSTHGAPFLVVFLSVVDISLLPLSADFRLSSLGCLSGDKIYAGVPFRVDFKVYGGVSEPYDVDLYEHNGDKNSVRRSHE